MLPSSNFAGLVVAITGALAQNQLSTDSLPGSITYIATFSPNIASNLTGTFSATADQTATTISLSLSSLPKSPADYPLQYTLYNSPLPPSGLCPSSPSTLTISIENPPFGALSTRHGPIPFTPSTTFSTKYITPALPPFILSDDLSLVISSATGQPITCANLWRATPIPFASDSTTIGSVSRKTTNGKSPELKKRGRPTTQQVAPRAEASISSSEATVSARENITGASTAASSVSLIIALTALICVC